METGAEREVKTERGIGRGRRDRRRGVRTKRGWTEGGMDGQMIETQNKQLIPDLMKLLFH